MDNFSSNQSVIENHSDVREGYELSSLNLADSDRLLDNRREVEETTEFCFDDLAQTDYIFISTQNHTYRFIITDAGKRLGILSGGSLGFERCQATLLGFLSKEAIEQPRSPLALKIGVNAAFDVVAPEIQGCLITSPITKLLVVRNRQRISQETQPIA